MHRLRSLIERLSRHSMMVVTALLIAVAVLMIWFLIVGASTSASQVTIGIAALAAFFAAFSAIGSLLQAVEVEKQDNVSCSGVNRI